MHARQKRLARTCLDGSEANTLTFPQIVAALSEGGFEGYAVDFRRATTTYFLPDGDSLELPGHRAEVAIGEALDAEALTAAIREAQTLAPDYSYRSFCMKAKIAGCAGYMVSFPGRRAVYFGRDGGVHTERFPGSADRP